MNNKVSSSKILIVDDNPTNLRVLYEYLSRFDYQVSVAQDGVIALEIINADKPDLILLDIMMPGITGIDLCKKLKSDPLTEDIPVIFISALAELNSKIIGFEAGAVDYITKPFQREEVLARVNAHLTIRNQRIRLKNEISERLKAEQKYRKFLDNTPGGILIVQDFMVKYANSAASKIFNRDISEFNNLPVLSILKHIPAHDVSRLLDYLRRILSKDISPNRMEVVYNDSEGHSHWIEVVFTVSEYEDSTSLQILLTDVTNRVEMLDLVNKTGAQLNALVETIPDIIYFKDLYGRYLIVNKAFEENCGLTRNEILGKTDKEIYPIEVFEKSYESDKIVFDEGKPYFVEDRITGKEGEERIYESNKYPILNSQNKSVGLVGVTREITERKCNEEKIKSYTEELKSTNAAKDKFFSIIAHDLKSPFTGFLGFSEYMARYSAEISPEDLEDFSNRMYESAKIVFNLLENLLQWSRLQTNRIEFEPEELNLADIANKIIRLNSINSTKKQIHLLNSINEDVIIYADENMIETVMRNLVSNAIKFTNSGGIVHLGVTKKGSFAEICVTDSGIGMEKEDMQKLFKIDQHFKSEGTEREQGTGLGLILCKEFVEKNTGKIWVESEPGKGSKFYFSIPLAH